MPPPAYCGARSEPCLARPVPFCRYGFLPPPRTSPRVFVACVPCRAAASCATTTWCMSGTLTLASKISGGSCVVAVAPAGRSGHSALDQQQAAIGVDAVQRQVGRRGALATHPARHPHALEHVARE